MSFLQFLIDTMCANFNRESMRNLVKARLDQGACTIDDIAQEIMQRDRTLDIVSAQRLAEAAVEALTESGEVTIRGAYVHPASRVAS